MVKTLEKKAVSRDRKNSGISREELEKAAYYRWQARGCPVGDPDKDWFEAESELGPGSNSKGKSPRPGPYFS